MTQDSNEPLGQVDDTTEEQVASDTTDGAAARGSYDPAQGSPGGTHPIGEDFPDEAAKAAGTDPVEPTDG